MIVDKSVRRGQRVRITIEATVVGVEPLQANGETYDGRPFGISVVVPQGLWISPHSHIDQDILYVPAELAEIIPDYRVWLSHSPPPPSPPPSESTPPE